MWLVLEAAYLGLEMVYWLDYGGSCFPFLRHRDHFSDLVRLYKCSSRSHFSPSTLKVVIPSYLRRCDSLFYSSVYYLATFDSFERDFASIMVISNSCGVKRLSFWDKERAAYVCLYRSDWRLSQTYLSFYGFIFELYGLFFCWVLINLLIIWLMYYVILTFKYFQWYHISLDKKSNQSNNKIFFKRYHINTSITLSM